MATPRFRMLSQALEAPEEGITYPLGVSPEEQPGLFEEASDAALARENARLKEGYVPAGTGPMVEPSLDSTLAPLPSGLRSRKPADFAPDTTKMQGKLAGFLGGDRSLASPIPINTAPSGSDAAAAVASTLPATTDKQPAGKPDSSGKDGMPAPSSEGAGGDASERDLYLARLAAQNAAGFGGMGAGKNIDMGIADTLGERLKQVQALRAKREEKEVTDAQEVANNKAQVDYLISRFPGQTDSLTKLYGMTRKANFPQLVRLEEQIALDKARRATEEVKPVVALRGAEVKEGTLEERVTHNRAMEAMARVAAALAAERAAKPAAEDRGVRPEALTNRLKDLNAQTKPFQEIVSSLQEADAALSALGTGQISRGAKIASKIPLVGESLVSTPELRAMQGQEGLKQSYQKLKTGLAAVGQELASFERQFGTDWQADPRKAPMAIETLKQITQDALRRTQAPFGAGTGNPAIDQMEVLSLLKNTGGLTADNFIFQPNPKLAAAAGMTPAPVTGRPAKPTAIPEGKAVLWSLAEGKWKAVPAENADAAVASGKYER